MTTNSPNTVDGEVQALICALEILKPEIATCPALTKAVDIALAALTAEPVALRYRHINDTRWKLEKNTQIDERLTKVDQELLYTTPPAQILRPVEQNSGKSSELAERAEKIMDDCNSLIRRINATEQPVSDEWVKCSERMPDSNEVRCLVFCRDGVTRTGFTSHGDWAMNGKYYDASFVTHWMPLPAAPGGQD